MNKLKELIDGNVAFIRQGIELLGCIDRGLYNKAAPPVYRWQIRWRIYRWYAVLREVDQRFREQPSATVLAADIDRLRQMQHELGEITVPLSYMEEFYNLHMHVDFIRQRLEQGQPVDVGSRRAA